MRKTCFVNVLLKMRKINSALERMRDNELDYFSHIGDHFEEIRRNDFVIQRSRRYSKLLSKLLLKGIIFSDRKDTR